MSIEHLPDARRLRAIKSTVRLQTWVDLNDLSSEVCDKMQREVDFLAGLLWGSQCQELVQELDKAVWKSDVKAAHNLTVALDNELTERTC